MKLERLTTKEIAEQYTDYEVSIVSITIPDGTIIGSICGYTKELVVIDSLPTSFKWFAGTPEHNYYYTRTSKKTPTTRVFRFFTNELILTKLSKPTPPHYPSKCSFCQQPSRKLAGFAMCSNVKCKSNKAMKKVLAKVKAPKELNIDAEDYLLCPLCGKRAVDAIREGVSGKAALTALKCSICGWRDLTTASSIILVNGMRLAIPGREKIWQAHLGRFEDAV